MGETDFGTNFVHLTILKNSDMTSISNFGFRGLPRLDVSGTLMKAMYSQFIFAGGPIHSVETDILTYLGFYLIKRQLESIKQDEK